MWREPEFSEIKQDNIKHLLSEKKEPGNYLDLLMIVEHPAFTQFYDDLIKDGVCSELDKDPQDRESVLGDIIKVGLKENYKEYDLFWPVIIRDAEEELVSGSIDFSKLKPFDIYRLEDLQKFFKTKGESLFPKS